MDKYRAVNAAKMTLGVDAPRGQFLMNRRKRMPPKTWCESMRGLKGKRKIKAESAGRGAI